MNHTDLKVSVQGWPKCCRWQCEVLRERIGTLLYEFISHNRNIRPAYLTLRTVVHTNLPTHWDTYPTWTPDLSWHLGRTNFGAMLAWSLSLVACMTSKSDCNQRPARVFFQWQSLGPDPGCTVVDDDGVPDRGESVTPVQPVSESRRQWLTPWYNTVTIPDELEKGLVFGRAMPQAVSPQPLTAEALLRTRVSPCMIYEGQRHTGSGFPPTSSVSPLSILFHRGSYIIWERAVGPLVATVQRYCLTPTTRTTTTATTSPVASRQLSTDRTITTDHTCSGKAVLNMLWLFECSCTVTHRLPHEPLLSRFMLPRSLLRSKWRHLKPVPESIRSAVVLIHLVS
jgi:hypothetical protein